MDPKPSAQIPPFLVFYLVHSVQIGIGILSFSREIVEVSDYHSWIAIILSGVVFHIIIWMMYFILNREKSDIVDIHNGTFGRVFGFVLTMLFVGHFVVSATVIVLVYASVVRIWIFPELETWVLSLAIFAVIYYGVSSGFRTIVGLCFLSLVIPSFLLLTSFYLIEFLSFEAILPLFDTTLTKQLRAMNEMLFSFFGPEVLLICYPFIQQAPKSQKYAHFGNILTTILYVFVALFSFMFFSEEDLKQIMFPTLTAWKIVHLPFIERFEYLGIAIWMIVIIPNMTMEFWAASRLLKRQFNVKQRYMLPIIIIIGFLITVKFQLVNSIEQLFSFTKFVGNSLVYVYIPLLFIIIAIKRRKTGEKNKHR